MPGNWSMCSHGDKGPPKSTTDGRDLGKNATNTIKVLGTNPKPASPTSNAASPNK